LTPIFELEIVLLKEALIDRWVIPLAKNVFLKEKKIPI